jgi:hypothetical protein
MFDDVIYMNVCVKWELVELIQIVWFGVLSVLSTSTIRIEMRMKEEWNESERVNLFS